MQELISKVAAAAEISDEQARKSIETVSSYLKEKIPEPLRGQIDHLVNGGNLSEGLKLKMSELAGDVRDKAESIFKEVRDAGENVAEKLKDIFSDKK